MPLLKYAYSVLDASFTGQIPWTTTPECANVFLVIDQSKDTDPTNGKHYHNLKVLHDPRVMVSLLVSC